MRAAPDLRVNGERIAADHPARRMQDVNVASAVAGRIKRTLDLQRSMVAPVGQHSARVLRAETERQFPRPAGVGVPA